MSDIKIDDAILVNEFTEIGVRYFKSEFDKLKHSNIPIIPIFIDSYGGEVYSLMAMLDIILCTDRPVATIALGKAMSCGSILLACGTPGFRFIGPNSTVMIHDLASFAFGKMEDLKADVHECDRLNNRIYNILDTKCGKKPGYFRKLIDKKHVDWYLNPEESVEHGIVDKIGIPMLEHVLSFDVMTGKERKSEKKVVLPKSRSVPKKRGK
jgi:ATP-dependent Clp endopeptidase proteolytic subunit ClpP